MTKTLFVLWKYNIRLKVGLKGSRRQDLREARKCFGSQVNSHSDYYVDMILLEPLLLTCQTLVTTNEIVYLQIVKLPKASSYLNYVFGTQHDSTVGDQINSV